MYGCRQCDVDVCETCYNYFSPGKEPGHGDGAPAATTYGASLVLGPFGVFVRAAPAQVTTGESELLALAEFRDANLPEVSPVYHIGHKCDVTGQYPIIGTRYHLTGKNYDICEAAFEKLPEARRAEFEAVEQSIVPHENLRKLASVKGWAELKKGAKGAIKGLDAALAVGEPPQCPSGHTMVLSESFPDAITNRDQTQNQKDPSREWNVFQGTPRGYFCDKCGEWRSVYDPREMQGQGQARWWCQQCKVDYCCHCTPHNNDNCVGGLDDVGWSVTKAGGAHVRALRLRTLGLTAAPKDVSQFPYLIELLLSYNEIHAPFPDISRCHHLKKLHLHNNWFSGPLPSGPNAWPTSLRMVMIENNPLLHGKIPKQLLVQCTGGLAFGGCKERHECTPEEKLRNEYLRFPFVVGITAASKDLHDFVFNPLTGLGIRSMAMLIDAPEAGDPAFEMSATYPPRWSPWQEAWRKGLLALERGSKIYVINADGMTRELPRFGGAPDPTDPTGFKAKFLGVEAFDTKAKRDTMCFDPTYMVPKGGRASTILDWERRQYLHVAKANGLEIVNFNGNHGSGGGVASLPEWYSTELG